LILPGTHAARDEGGSVLPGRHEFADDGFSVGVKNAPGFEIDLAGRCT
jgi:hypothetical protein